MRRVSYQTLFSVFVLMTFIITIIPAANSRGNILQRASESESLQIATGNTTWHDDCSSTGGWIALNSSSGFDPKHLVLESGTLSSTSGYLIVTDIADPVTERMGPLYVKELGEGVPLDAISLFQAEVAFTYTSVVEGFLSVYLFDENKQKAVMLRLHDAWSASESHPESTFFAPGEAGDGTLHYEVLFGSWTGYLRFWYDSTTGTLVGELDDGTPNTATLKASGEFDANRKIKYIGIQWSRHPGVIYVGENYRLLDIQLTYNDFEASTDWLDGWTNRKAHQIHGASGAGINYQVQITVNYGAGVDSGNDVYCNSQCRPDFEDIRFADDDGITLLDYWTEYVHDSNQASFWVEVSDDLSFDTVIYIYYGNSGASSLSNGTATFIFFDDYENNNLDRWDGTNGPGYSCATDQVVHGTYALKFSATPGADIFTNLTDTGEPLTHDFMVHSWVRDDNQLRGGHVPLVKSQSQWWVYACRGYGTQFAYFQGGADYVHWPYNYTGASDTWFEINVGLSMSTDKIRAWKSGFYMGEINLIAANGASVPDDLFQIGFGQQSAYITWWDDTYVRKWIVNEPVQDDWYGQEIFRWYHDCSNTTGFVYNDAWNMNWMQWDIQSGTLSSSGDALSVSSVVTGLDWHGPVFEYALPDTFRVRDINRFSAVFNVDNSLTSYLGYEVLMLGDQNRNPVIFFSFHDGWADYCRGSYGVAYVFPNGSYYGFGSGYPVGWTSFNGEMNASYAESGLLAHVEGIGQSLIPGLSEADYNREIEYIAIASARFGSDPLIPVFVDEITINYSKERSITQPIISGDEDFNYELGTLGHVLRWTIEGFSPTGYNVYRNGELFASDSSPAGTDIEIGIDGLALGSHNFTIVVDGAEDVSVSDSILVNVVDTTAPSISHFIDLGTGTISIIWQPTDLLPLNYEIRRNGTLVSNGEWTSGANITYTLGENLALGTYNVTIDVWDTSGNHASNTAFVTIGEGSSPLLGDYLTISISVGSIAVIVVIAGLVCRNRAQSAPESSQGYQW